jgi:hypothetical protein
MKFKTGTIATYYGENSTGLLNHLRIMSNYRKTIIVYNDRVDLSEMSIGKTVNVIYIKKMPFEYQGTLNFYKREN